MKKKTKIAFLICCVALFALLIMLIVLGMFLGVDIQDNSPLWLNITGGIVIIAFLASAAVMIVYDMGWQKLKEEIKQFINN